MKPVIYIVDDEEVIRDLYHYSLENDFDSKCFENGTTFFDELDKGKPDLIVLDVMLPDINGYDILEKLKSNKKYQDIPVIMVSAKDEEISKVKGLNLGADDYLSKPFGVLELVARIKTNLRKNNIANAGLITYRDITIDDEKHQIIIKDSIIDLPLKEYNLLKLLCLNPNKAITRDDIFSAVWGADYIGESRTLDMHINSLRKKIEISDREIKTIRSIGFLIK